MTPGTRQKKLGMKSWTPRITVRTIAKMRVQGVVDGLLVWTTVTWGRGLGWFTTTFYMYPHMSIIVYTLEETQCSLRKLCLLSLICNYTYIREIAWNNNYTFITRSLNMMYTNKCLHRTPLSLSSKLLSLTVWELCCWEAGIGCWEAGIGCWEADIGYW